MGPNRRPRSERPEGALSVPIVPDDKDWTWVLERPCPECGFEASAVPPESVATRLRANATAWERVLRRPDDLVRRRPADDRWSPLEYACHVRDVCTLYHQRLDLMLREDDPLYPNWDQDATAVGERYGDAGSSDRLGAAGRGRRPAWPMPSTVCTASNGSGRAVAATAPASASRASAATCSTTQSIISTTSRGVGGPETPTLRPLSRAAGGPSRARGRRWRGRWSAGPTPGRPS